MQQRSIIDVLLPSIVCPSLQQSYVKLEYRTTFRPRIIIEFQVHYIWPVYNIHLWGAPHSDRVPVLFSTLNLLWDSQRCMLNVPYFTSCEQYINFNFYNLHDSIVVCPTSCPLENSRVAQIDSSLIPDVSSAISLYQACGGQLGAVTGFGVDPLADSPELPQERQSWRQAFLNQKSCLDGQS